MKLFLIAASVLALAAPAFAEPAGGMGAMGGMSHSDQTMTMADGAGVVTAVDAGAGRVTIHHGPIAKLNWPAMTMDFKADPPGVLRGIRTGQAVTFTLMQMAGETTLTAIHPK